MSNGVVLYVVCDSMQMFCNKIENVVPVLVMLRNADHFFVCFFSVQVEFIRGECNRINSVIPLATVIITIVLYCGVCSWACPP